MKDDRLYVSHVLDCIHRIERYCKDGKDSFMRSELIQDAVLRNLQVLAESTQRISDVLKTAHPEIGWRGVAGFRNILVHNYLGIRLERVWEIISADVPALRSCLESIQTELDRRRIE